MSYNIELYNLDIADNKFTLVDDLSGGNFSRLNYSYQRNRYGACTFNVNADFMKSMSENYIPYRTHVNIRRGESSVWFGPIDKLSGSYGNVRGSLTISAYEYFFHLFARYTDRLTNYLGVDAGEIAWNLIDLTQGRENGELFIRRGDIEATMLRDRGYEYGNIGELITNLTEVIGGFDFSFTIAEDGNKFIDHLNFNVQQSMGVERVDLPTLRLGNNVQSVSLDFVGDLFTHFTSLGFGDGEDRMVYSEGDPAYQFAFSRRERIMDYSAVSVYNTLIEHTKADLDFYKKDRYDIVIELNPRLAPFFNDFFIGDVLHFDFDQPGFFSGKKGRLRIDEIGVQVDDVGAEYLTIKGRQL